MAAIVLKACADVLGPYLTKTAIDKYLSARAGGHSFLDRFLSPQPTSRNRPDQRPVPERAAAGFPL